MARITDITQIIDKAIAAFDKRLPSIQTDLLGKVLLELKDLDLKGGKIAPTAANLKRVLKLQGTLDKVTNSTDYKKSLKGLTGSIDSIAVAQDTFYKDIFQVKQPPAMAQIIRDAARNSVIDNLTQGLSSEIYNSLQDVLNTGVIAGSSYADLTKEIQKLFTTNKENEGLVQKYAKQIAKDTVNIYARQYGVTMTAGLNFQWFVYTGSNISTTRDFCIACKKKRYIHISEFPVLIKGNFPEFKAIPGKIYQKYGLPEGMRQGTNASNFRIYAGGYNCGHQLRPIYEYQIPPSVKKDVYATAAYKSWLKDNPKAI